MQKKTEQSLLFSAIPFFSFLLPVPLLSFCPLRVEEKVNMSQQRGEKKE
jgi:hypothetical protein